MKVHQLVVGGVLPDVLSSSVCSWFWVGEDVRYPTAAHDPQGGHTVVSIHLNQ